MGGFCNEVRCIMKKENNFLDLMGEIDEKFVYEASLPWEKRNVNLLSLIHI